MTIRIIAIISLAAVCARGFADSEVGDERILAGLWAYPPQVVGWIADFGAHAEAYDAIAARIDGSVAERVRALPREARTKAERLQRWPKLLELVHDYPGFTARVAQMHAADASGLDAQLAEARLAQRTVRHEAAVAWEDALRRDPVALGEYRTLLSEYCVLKRLAAPEFEYVRVTDRRYYLACAPNAEFMQFAEGRRLPPSLKRVLTQWWDSYAPQQRDARALALRLPTAPIAFLAKPLAEADARVRQGWWSTAEAAPGTSLGLMPVGLQPPTDRSGDAARSWRVAEHLRIWEAAAPLAFRAREGAERIIREPSDDLEIVWVGADPARDDDAAQAVLVPAGDPFFDEFDRVFGRLAQRQSFVDAFGGPSRRLSLAESAAIGRSITGGVLLDGIGLVGGHGGYVNFGGTMGTAGGFFAPHTHSRWYRVFVPGAGWIVAPALDDDDDINYAAPPRQRSRQPVIGSGTQIRVPRGNGGNNAIRPAPSGRNVIRAPRR